MSKHLDQIKTLLAEGLSVRDISKQLELSFQRVYTIMETHDIPKPGYAPSEKLRPEVVTLYHEGYSVSEIGEATNLNNQQVLYILWKNKLTIADRGRSLLYTGPIPAGCRWEIGPRVWPSLSKAGYYAMTAKDAIDPRRGVWHLCTCSCGREQIRQKQSILSGSSRQCGSCSAAEKAGRPYPKFNTVKKVKNNVY